VNFTSKNKNKKCSRRKQERSRTQDFILVHPPQGLHPVICQQAKISTNQDYQDHFSTIQALGTNKNTLFLAVTNLLNPSASQIQYKLHYTQQ